MPREKEQDAFVERLSAWQEATPTMSDAARVAQICGQLESIPAKFDAYFLAAIDTEQTIEESDAPRVKAEWLAEIKRTGNVGTVRRFVKHLIALGLDFSLDFSLEDTK